MSIEIKRSIKPVNYYIAINKLEKKVDEIIKKNTKKELIWFLEHPSIFTAGTSFSNEEILDNKITVIKTKRGGKITWHGPGQLICYLVIDLNKRKKDIRKFINLIEKSIIETLYIYKVKSFADRKNVGIWCKSNKKLYKIGAIGIRIKRWIAFHGFSININNDLKQFKKIIPCGIKDMEVSNLINIKKQNYTNFSIILQKKLIKYLKN